MDHLATAPRMYGLPFLPSLFCVQESYVGGNRKARVILRICGPIFSFVVFPYWGLVYRFIQPKVNQLYAEKSSTEALTVTSIAKS